MPIEQCECSNCYSVFMLYITSDTPLCYSCSMNDPLYEDPQPELQLQSNPAYEMVDKTAQIK